MVAVERCQQYVEGVPQEDLDGGVIDTPYGWPREAIVSFKDVNFRYRDHLPPALKGFTLETKSKEKVRKKCLALSEMSEKCLKCDVSRGFFRRLVF